MDRFEQVSIIKKANIYFSGQVTSRTIVFPGGEKKTLGIMLPGEYEFGTDCKEVMEILGGDLDVRLPGSEEWKTFREGDRFEVPAQSKFSLVVRSTTDYCCSYLEG